MMPIERFTGRAQDVPHRAAEIMQRYGHTQIDTAHVLLALIEQPRGVPSQIFELLKIDATALAERLDPILRSSTNASDVVVGAGQLAITPRVVQIINLANDEANRMKDEKISTEHIFLGILSERGTPAARLLADAGIDHGRVSGAIQQLRGANAE